MSGKRDELGKFIPGGTLSPEHIEKMKEGRKTAKEARGEVELNANLLALGFTGPPFPADILTLGKLFVEGKGGSVSAYNKLLALSPTRREEIGVYDPESGEPCPVCLGQSGETLSKIEAKHPGFIDMVLKYTEDLKGETE